MATALATDQPDGAFDRKPLHWPLVFPEVFDPTKPGFDAVIGNPPFLGGQRLTGTLGVAYRQYLVTAIGQDARGSADLVAYFVLHVHQLLNASGQSGLIATNTLAEGATRAVGLQQLTASDVTIRQAVRSAPWPSRSAALQYCAIWTSRTRVGADAQFILDGRPVTRITSALNPASRITGNPYKLATNASRSFQGSIILGLGFTMTREDAYELIANDSRNAEVLFPYLNGQDLNSRPDCSASRWVIDFHDWPEERAKTFPECYDRVRRLVKPERARAKRASRRDRWWQYAERAVGLYRAIAGEKRVLACSEVTKHLCFAWVDAGMVYSANLDIFPNANNGLFAVLNTSIHDMWARKYSAQLETRLKYSTGNAFETFPFPEMTVAISNLGVTLDDHRRKLMLARQAGLTIAYNLVHGPKCADADIAELRDIHRAIDEAVVRAYGWTDLLDPGLDHGFHDTRQGVRYTIGPVVRQEILDRLLELNHARYAAEVQPGLHNKRPRKKPISNNSGEQLLF